MKKTERCIDLMNATACTVKDLSGLNEIVKKNGYTVENKTFKNGKRAMITDSSGNWKMTVIKYDLDDGMLVLKSSSRT